MWENLVSAAVWHGRVMYSVECLLFLACIEIIVSKSNGDMHAIYVIVCHLSSLLLTDMM